MITIRQFEGWCKKAYPDVRLAALTDGSKIASTRDKFNDFNHPIYPQKRTNEFITKAKFK